ncbi:MAG: oxidoreductase, partial [Candidatus Omnitrophica bacterium]|nr:oxidoreductase [Candidatus Omnitrophota bacterium]
MTTSPSTLSQARPEAATQPLTDQVAIVTGGARGIGREIAL